MRRTIKKCERFSKWCKRSVLSTSSLATRKTPRHICVHIVYYMMITIVPEAYLWFRHFLPFCTALSHLSFHIQTRGCWQILRWSWDLTFYEVDGRNHDPDWLMVVHLNNIDSIKFLLIYTKESWVINKHTQLQVTDIPELLQLCRLN